MMLRSGFEKYYKVIGQPLWGNSHYIIEVNEGVKEFIEENIEDHICNHCGKLLNNTKHTKIQEYLKNFRSEEVKVNPIILETDYTEPSYVCCCGLNVILGTHQ